MSRIKLRMTKNEAVLTIIIVLMAGLFISLRLMVEGVETHCKELTQNATNNMRGEVWSCMDGCSNMQDLIFDFNVDNKTMEDLHNDCSDMCFEVYAHA
jgi:hypothetical protein